MDIERAFGKVSAVWREYWKCWMDNEIIERFQKEFAKR